MKKILVLTNLMWIIVLSLGLTMMLNTSACAETYHVSPDGFGGYNMTNNTWGGYGL